MTPTIGLVNQNRAFRRSVIESESQVFFGRELSFATQPKFHLAQFVASSHPRKAIVTMEVLHSRWNETYNPGMSIAADSTNIFMRVVKPEQGTLEPELAKFVMGLEFPAEDQRRFDELSSKAQQGNLTQPDADLLDGYLHVDSLLSILRLKAQRSLNAAG